MKIPKRYEDLTVDQFQQLELLKSTDLDKLDKAIKRLSILSGESVDDLELLTPQTIYSLLIDASFLTEPCIAMSVPESFMLGFTKFKYIKHVHEYTTAQQKDFTTILKHNGNDYIKCLPELMAICHLELGLNGYEYKPENHGRNVKLFRKSKLKKSLGAVFFYSNCLKSYSRIIADCLAGATLTVNQMMREISEDSEFQTFLNNGGGNTR